MKPNSYSQVPVSPWTPIDVRPLLPIYPPPEPLEQPALPTKQRTPSFDAPFTLSTHLIPACYLRRGRFAPMLQPIPPNLSKEEREQKVKEYYHDLRVERGAMVTDGHPKILWNCLNRYVRKGLVSSNGTGLTLFFAHANGFPKEVCCLYVEKRALTMSTPQIWEPTLATLLSSPASHIIDEIWCWESVQHGDAALVNHGSISRYCKDA